MFGSCSTLVGELVSFEISFGDKVRHKRRGKETCEERAKSILGTL